MIVRRTHRVMRAKHAGNTLCIRYGFEIRLSHSPAGKGLHRNPGLRHALPSIQLLTKQSETDAVCGSKVLLLLRSHRFPRSPAPAEMKS